MRGFILFSLLSTAAATITTIHKCCERETSSSCTSSAKSSADNDVAEDVDVPVKEDVNVDVPVQEDVNVEVPVNIGKFPSKRMSKLKTGSLSLSYVGQGHREPSDALPDRHVGAHTKSSYIIRIEH